MARIRKRRRADGGVSYQVRWVVGGGAAGAAQTEAAETFTSRSRALAFAAEVEEAGHDWPTNSDGVRWTKGLGYVAPIVEVNSGPSTFHHVAISYFEYQTRMMKLGHLKPYTLHRYRRSYELHLSTTFGPMAFADLQPLDIEDWMVEQRDLPSTGKSIRNRHGLLFSILMHGQKRLGLRPDNPAELTRLPSKDGELGRQVRFFQHGEWALLRSCLRSDVHLLVDVALATGMRWGELAALRREDLSFPDGETVRIHVVRAWSKRAADEDSPINRTVGENRAWKLGPPKSRRSRHVVVRGEDAIRLREAVSSLPSDIYVSRTAEGNPWRYPDFHSDRWVPAKSGDFQLAPTGDHKLAIDIEAKARPRAQPTAHERGPISTAHPRPPVLLYLLQPTMFSTLWRAPQLDRGHWRLSHDEPSVRVLARRRYAAPSAPHLRSCGAWLAGCPVATYRSPPDLTASQVARCDADV